MCPLCFKLFLYSLLFKENEKKMGLGKAGFYPHFKGRIESYGVVYTTPSPSPSPSPSTWLRLRLWLWLWLWPSPSPSPSTWLWLYDPIWPYMTLNWVKTQLYPGPRKLTIFFQKVIFYISYIFKFTFSPFWRLFFGNVSGLNF